MKKTIVTRSQNEQLYNVFKSFLSNENDFRRYTSFNGFVEAKEYLLSILNLHSGWIVNADEDFFVCNESEIDNLISAMEENGYDYCGVADGGIIPHRTNSAYNVNPFFNVFNCDKIKEKLHEFTEQKGIEARNKLDPNDQMTEPFAGLLFWLYDNFHCLFLEDIESTDGTSTVIKFNNKPIGIHSWYSRVYGKDEAQTKRIDECIEWAKLNQMK